MYSSKTNKMQRYTTVFITINALHVSGGFSAHHQEFKTVHTASGICWDFVEIFLLLTTIVSEMELNICSNKYQCVTLHLVGLAWIHLQKYSLGIVPRQIGVNGGGGTANASPPKFLPTNNFLLDIWAEEEKIKKLEWEWG